MARGAEPIGARSAHGGEFPNDGARRQADGGRGLCSRREAERLIDAGWSWSTASRCGQGPKAPADADITVAASGAAARRHRRLHKPLGIVSTQPEPGQTPAWQLVRADAARRDRRGGAAARLADPRRLSVAGRLDRASRGLLILTQDGTVARRIIGGQGVEKAYLVRTAAPSATGRSASSAARCVLDGQPLLPMRVTASPPTAALRAGRGKKHQIRRVCRHSA